MSTRKYFSIVLAVFVFLAACSGDSTGPSYRDVSGSYDGEMAGISEGVALQAIFSLTITQNGGSLSGSWAIQGELSDGIDVVSIQGTGTLTGTIAPGNNPSVNLTIRNGTCPNYSAQFSGSYDVPNGRLTLSGPVEILSDCDVFLSYPSVIILTR